MSINRVGIFYISIIALACGFFVPVGFDWRIYADATPTTPYSTPGFIGTPFAYLFLPHALLSANIGNAVNVCLNVLAIVLVTRKYAGNRWYIASLLAITTPQGLLLMRNNNIDWIPLMSFLVADWLAYPMLAVKPQALAGAAVIRFKRNPSWLQLLPLALVGLLSVIVWPFWWQRLGGDVASQSWNFAPFPYLLPVGVWLLWKAWREDDEIIAACSTMFFVPYVAYYSLVGVHALIATRDRRAGALLWLVSYWYMVLLLKR
jgi:hypothetical protein